MDRLEKVATPADEVAEVVPERVPPPGLRPMATFTVTAAPVRLPNPSSTRTVIPAGVMMLPAEVLVGWLEKASLDGAPAAMAKPALVAEVRVPEVAWRV